MSMSMSSSIKYMISFTLSFSLLYLFEHCLSKVQSKGVAWILLLFFFFFDNFSLVLLTKVFFIKKRVYESLRKILEK